MAVKVHAANEHDSKSGYKVLERLKGRFDQVKKIYADGGHRGELIDKVKHMLNYDMKITLRTYNETYFKPLPKRWVVERSFAWLDDFCKLAKYYEREVVCSENMAHPAFITLAIT